MYLCSRSRNQIVKNGENTFFYLYCSDFSFECSFSKRSDTTKTGRLATRIHKTINNIFRAFLIFLFCFSWESCAIRTIQRVINSLQQRECRRSQFESTSSLEKFCVFSSFFLSFVVIKRALTLEWNRFVIRTSRCRWSSSLSALLCRTTQKWSEKTTHIAHTMTMIIVNRVMFC